MIKKRDGTEHRRLEEINRQKGLENRYTVPYDIRLLKRSFQRTKDGRRGPVRVAFVGDGKLELDVVFETWDYATETSPSMLGIRVQMSARANPNTRPDRAELAELFRKRGLDQHPRVLLAHGTSRPASVCIQTVGLVPVPCQGTQKAPITFLGMGARRSERVAGCQVELEINPDSIEIDDMDSRTGEFIDQATLLQHQSDIEVDAAAGVLDSLRIPTNTGINRVQTSGEHGEIKRERLLLPLAAAKRRLR